MEKFYICSDVHGDYQAFSAFLEKAENNPIVICGDLVPYSQSFSNLLSSVNNDLYIVKGNCDNAYDFSIANINIPPRFLFENFFSKNVLITHGDRIRYPKESPIELKENDIFIFGHTHVAQLFIDEDNIINLNPGSLSRPRGKFNSSYAVMYENKIIIKTLNNNKTILDLNF